MHHRKLLPAAAASLLATGLLAAGFAHSAPADAAAAVPAGDGGGRTTTLLTGDRVTLSADGGVSVTPGPGRSKVAMLTSTVRGRVRVVPADAVPLLRAGRLDPRLFDVTGLLADGYDDRRPDLPVIVSPDSGVTGTVVHRMNSLRAAALHTRKRDLGKVWSAFTRKGATGKVWLDAKGHWTGAEGVQQIGATQAWSAGLTGTGMTVAVLDSGVDTAHPDLASRVTTQVDFSPVATGGAPTTTDIHDNAGHGTHVASIIAGTGTASNGRYKGVAPDAKIVSGKVGDWDVAESSVIAGMEWAAGTEHASVVNMSLGFPDAPGDDPVETALDGLTARYGTLFVVAAGNDGANGDNQNGAEDYAVGSPATADAALSVGAVDHDDKLADFSSRGPRLGDDAIKPEITAPGVDITGALSSDAGGSGYYDTGYGTSYAAPYVAGSAILLKQKHPEWAAAELKEALMGSARPAAGVGVFAQGAGRVDVPAALSDPVLADPPSLSLGTTTWPHTDDGAVTRTVTYRNPGTVAQNLRLRLTVDGPDMRPTSGLFKLDRSTLTVPAGGSAQVKVTAAPSATAPAGPYSGELTATTAARSTVHTPVGLVRQAATHTLSLHHVGLDGTPTLNYYTAVVGLDTPFEWDSLYHYNHDYPADWSLSVPEGHYAVVTQMFPDDGPGLTYIARPNLSVGADTDLTQDARDGKPVRITVPEAGAVRTGSTFAVGIRNGSNGWVTFGNALNGLVDVSSAQLGGNAPTGRVVTEIHSAFGDGQNPSAYAYQLAYFQPGGVPTGFTRTVTRNQLAVENTAAQAQAPIGQAAHEAAATLPGYPLAPQYVDAPLAKTRYFNTDGGIGWTSRIAQWSDDGSDYYSVTTTGTRTTYRAGRAYASTWNAPIVAPCPAAGTGWTGDQLSVRVGPYCDSAGHPGYLEQRDTGGTTTLYRDGTEVATSDLPGHALFTVHPDGASYRLDVDATRASSFGLSTHVTADWTFTGAAAAAHLPAVRMTPVLDASGSTPAGGEFTIPIAVHATAVTLQVSYDGVTWQPASVIRTGNGAFAATVTNPATAGYASVKVHATGGTATVDETVLNAYRIGS